MSVPSAGMLGDGPSPGRLPAAAPAHAASRSAAPGRRPAGRGDARGRPAARAGRAGDRQDHGDRRGGDPADHGAPDRSGTGPGPDLQPQGSAGVAGADHHPAAPDHPAAAGADLPQLRLRAGAPGVRAGRGRPAHPAVRPRAAAGSPADAARRGGRGKAGRHPSLAGAAPAGLGHPRFRHGTARFPAPRGRARAGRPGTGPAGPRPRPGRLGRRGGLPGPLYRALRPGPRAGVRLCGDRPDRCRAAEPCGDPRP